MAKKRSKIDAALEEEIVEDELDAMQDHVEEDWDEEDDWSAGLTVQKVETGQQIRMNVLVYGLIGVGKTRLLGSAMYCEHTKPMLLVDVEGGTLSLSGSDIDVVRPQNFSEIQELYDYLRYDNHQYRSVGIDSVTEIQRKLSMADILGTLQEDASYTNLAGHTPPQRYDWLSSGEQMRRFIRAFKDLAYLPDESRRIHVFLTALEKRDEERGIVCPSLPGILGVEIGAAVDVLARMSVKTIEQETEDGLRVKQRRHLSLREEIDPVDETRYLAKSRTPENVSFPKEVWNPTVDKLLEHWLS